MNRTACTAFFQPLNGAVGNIPSGRQSWLDSWCGHLRIDDLARSYDLALRLLYFLTSQGSSSGQSVVAFRSGMLARKNLIAMRELKAPSRAGWLGGVSLVMFSHRNIRKHQASIFCGSIPQHNTKQHQGSENRCYVRWASHLQSGKLQKEFA